MRPHRALIGLASVSLFVQPSSAQQLIGAASQRHGVPGEFGGGPAIPTAVHRGERSCVSPAQRAAVDRAVAEYAAARPAPAVSRAKPLYPFLPLGGTLYRDLLPPGYVDHDAGSGFQDYACGVFTYDTHSGTDIGLRSFEEQAIGVPVFAALGGVVVYAHDGEPDMNTCWCGQLSNLVVVDHGEGRYGEYWHLKNGSVAVGVGQTVAAGTVIGLAASSGNSSGPHLHFETRDQPGNVVFDPFGGPCSGPTGWMDQPSYVLDTYVADFGFMSVTPWTEEGYPYRFPTTQQRAFGEPFWWWMQIVNLPPYSTFREVYVRPNGTVAFDSGDLAFDNPEFYRVSNYWFATFFVPEMDAIAGEWRIRMLINGEIVSDTPLVVASTINPSLNRAPEPVAVSLYPSAPSPEDVLMARVESDLVLEDPDYDLVSFRYVWRVNGAVVRDRTWAGRMDALPAGTVSNGDVVEVAVTPHDGKAAGPQAGASVTVGGCAADYNGDGAGDILDFLDFFEDFAVCEGQSGPCGTLGDADFNGDTAIDILDFLDFFEVFAVGC